MRLTGAQVQNYKCVEDSNNFRTDDLTCLVGKNESGKSALLEALYRINPDLPERHAFDKTHFPRRRWRDWSDAEEERDNIVTTTWELDSSELTHLQGLAGQEAFPSTQVNLLKGYDNQLRWFLTINNQAAVDALMEQSNLAMDERDTLRSQCHNVAELIDHLESLDQLSDSQSEFLDTLRERFPQKDFQATAIAFLSPRVPHFVYFADYYKLPGRVSVEDLTKRQSEGNLSVSDRMFEALLSLVGGTINDITSETTSEHLISEIEGLQASITDEIFEYWTQNRHLEVKCHYGPGLAEDPAPFNKGYVFQTRIYNERHRSTVNFDDRSSGFIWFFSFLVWFSQAKRNYGNNLVLLLDEPGLSLHATAQRDLLRYIKERLLPDHQVVYTTHSPFMIDPTDLLTARTVEDVELNGEVLGTKVQHDVLSTDAETVFPLRGALGYDVTQTLFVGYHNLLVEGPSDLLYLQWASSALRSKGGVSLDTRWTVTPCGGLKKISAFLALFSGMELHLAVLTDFGHGDKGEVRRLRESELLKSGHVLTAEMYVTDQTEADIEDILGRDCYVALVNASFGLSGSKALPAVKPDQAPQQAVKEVEAHFKSLAPDDPEFDHYIPAAYLSANSTQLSEDLPGIEDALQRFDSLFGDLNALLRTEESRGG